MFIENYINLLEEALNIKNNLTNKIIIKYEDYVNDKNYRINILHKLNIKLQNIEDFNKNIITKQGGGKTFKKNIRILQLNNEELIILKKNKYFLELVRKYYNYNLIEKINKNL